jgi:hypothetical protein
MKPCEGKVDPWLQILGNLRDMSASSTPAVTMRFVEASPGARRKPPAPWYVKTAPDPACASNVTINVLDRMERVATIAWHDPTSCHYDDQRWHRCIARRAGVCALTGARIVRGADIFRPSHSRPVPVNAHAMILTSALPEVHRVDVA